ncbi:hypothetical protein [Parapedobacter tibetensis]|uniref:hypothetical protein n=1 Tax=Parapedobacter tibetensis TaxID=2972951 RepID=UPI00214D7E06|nr:hypothetical protein [Parapedobacter tibetensis]
METNIKRFLPLAKYFVLLMAVLFFSGCKRADFKGDLSTEKANVFPIDESYKGNILFNANLDNYTYRDANDTDERKKIRASIINHLKDLKTMGVRESVGYLAVGGKDRKVEKGDPIDFDYLDKMYKVLDEEGIRYAIPLIVDRVVVNPDDYGPVWEENCRWYVQEMARYYGTRPLYYSAVNEPFTAGMRGDGVPLTVDQVLRIQEVFYRALKAVNPEIIVISCPVNTLEINRGSVQLAERGITQYCDYFGFHKHVDIGEDAPRSEKLIWDAIDRAEEMGFPRRGIVLNENGTHLILPRVWSGATEEDARDFKARWVGNDLIQMKALGCKYIVMYSLLGSKANNGEYNILDVDRPTANGFTPYEKEYQAYKELWQVEPHLVSRGINGGFEEENPDKSRGWVVSFKGWPRGGAQSSIPQEWESVDFIHDDSPGAFKGDSYLKMAKPIRPQISANRCRRLVEGLIPGQRYKICARVKLSGDSSRATLRGMGFDVLGKEKAEKVVTYAESQGKYTRIEVSFVAVNEWVVISLEHNGEGVAYWDEITFTK